MRIRDVFPRRFWRLEKYFKLNEDCMLEYKKRKIIYSALEKNLHVINRMLTTKRIE